LQEGIDLELTLTPALLKEGNVFGFNHTEDGKNAKEFGCEFFRKKAYKEGGILGLTF